MEQYINKDTLVAEINRTLSAFENSDAPIDRLRASTLIALLSFIDTLEVKEVDLEKELSYEDYKGFFEKYPNLSDDWGFDETWVFAKYFFELGLKTQYSSISIPNIDDLLEEGGIDPNSKDVKIFKECYYMALEKLKEKKGE